MRFVRKVSEIYLQKAGLRIFGKVAVWTVGVVVSLCVAYLFYFLLPGPKVITDLRKEAAFEKCQGYYFDVLIPDDKILDHVSMTIQFPGRIEDYVLTSTYYDLPSARVGEGIWSGQNDTGCLFLNHINQPSNVQFSLDSMRLKASVDATNLQGLLRSYYLVSNRPPRELPSSQFVVKAYYEYRVLGFLIRKPLRFKF